MGQMEAGDRSVGAAAGPGARLLQAHRIPPGLEANTPHLRGPASQGVAAWTQKAPSLSYGDLALSWASPLRRLMPTIEGLTPQRPDSA